MTMAAPYWVSLMVVFLMTVRNGVTAIEPHDLEPIVQDILNRYTPEYNGANNNGDPPMFSVAVSVPRNKDNKFDMNEVRNDNGEVVKTKILNCEVYTGNRVVAATVLKWPNVFHQCPNEPVQWDVPKNCHGNKIKTWADINTFCDDEYIRKNLYPLAAHAESRTLDYFEPSDKIRKNSKDDLMVFYVRDSPCDGTCTDPKNKRNILSKIQAITEWTNRVVVFSNIFRPADNNNQDRVNELRESLERLADKIADKDSNDKDKRSNGLQHIFRCYRQPEMYEEKTQMKCYSCNTSGKVAHKCVSNVNQPRGERE